MDKYQIINPCDPYIFEADNDLVATAVVLLIGDGMYGGRRVSGEDEFNCPMLAFAPAAEVDGILQNLFGCSFAGFILAHKSDIKRALRSVTIGDAVSYDELTDTVSWMSPENAVEYRKNRHDRKRSSWNDIGGRAHAIADAM